jgi:hypothetical protein
MSHSSNLRTTAQEAAADLGQKAQAAVKQQTETKADQARQAAAGKVQQAANAADAAAQRFDPASAQAQALQRVADQIEDVALKLRSADLRDLAGQATDIARRHPVASLSAAALAGFVAARFFKARDPKPMNRTDASDPWTSGYAGSRANRPEHVDTTTVMADINGDRTHG